MILKMVALSSYTFFMLSKKINGQTIILATIIKRKRLQIISFNFDLLITILSLFLFFN